MKLKTKINLKHHNRESLTCIVDFYITREQKVILENTWSVQLYDQYIRLAPSSFSKTDFKNRCKYTIGYKGIPKEVKPSEIFELTKNLDGKSCYTFKASLILDSTMRKK